MSNNCLPPTTKKTAYHTCNKVNEDIRNKTISNIITYKDSGGAILSKKIKKLTHEWDTERVLEVNAGSMILISSIMGYKKKRSNCFLMTGAVGFFLLQHAIQGWCPPLPVIRKLGVRTAEEINHEKTVYKIKRGDFSESTNDADELLKMAEKE